jgi:hypothetical protein
MASGCLLRQRPPSTQDHQSLARLIAEAEASGRRVPKSVAAATVEARNTPGARDLRPEQAAEDGGRGRRVVSTKREHRLRPRSCPAANLGRQPYQGLVIPGTRSLSE